MWISKQKHNAQVATLENHIAELETQVEDYKRRSVAITKCFLHLKNKTSELQNDIQKILFRTDSTTKISAMDFENRGRFVGIIEEKKYTEIFDEQYPVGSLITVIAEQNGKSRFTKYDDNAIWRLKYDVHGWLKVSVHLENDILPEIGSMVRVSSDDPCILLVEPADDVIEDDPR